MWNDKKEETTNALVEFLLLQLVFHHPGGVSDVRDGAMHRETSSKGRQTLEYFSFFYVLSHYILILTFNNYIITSIYKQIIIIFKHIKSRKVL